MLKIKQKKSQDEVAETTNLAADEACQNINEIDIGNIVNLKNTTLDIKILSDIVITGVKHTIQGTTRAESSSSDPSCASDVVSQACFDTMKGSEKISNLMNMVHDSSEYNTEEHDTSSDFKIQEELHGWSVSNS